MFLPTELRSRKYLYFIIIHYNLIQLVFYKPNTWLICKIGPIRDWLEITSMVVNWINFRVEKDLEILKGKAGFSL
jgi:hypothetical protein